jgi:hypothetical protein
VSCHLPTCHLYEYIEVEARPSVPLLRSVYAYLAIQPDGFELHLKLVAIYVALDVILQGNG